MKRIGHDESWVKKQIKLALKEYKIFYFMPSAGRFGKSGIPDFICCKHGLFISIETKFGGKVPTDLQNARMKEIQGAGGVTMVVDETNIEKAVEWLRDL